MYVIIKVREEIMIDIKLQTSYTQSEISADVKAAYKMSDLYDELIKINPELVELNLNHKFNVFFSRLLFCYFAEDTNLFKKEVLFTGFIKTYTKEDGSDLKAFLEKLFEILNTPEVKREKIKAPDLLNSFEYVNGGLFKDTAYSPKFSKKSRRLLIELGESLDWGDINPDIFGSMIQAVIHTDQRRGMGMHYTSVPNIMKVIEPLFLNELREEFDNNSDNTQKLKKLLDRIYKLKIFDPACGSGNFLIIAYKELRKLEMDIFSQLQKNSKDWGGDKSTIMSGIRLSQFYGIELDDFAHEVAILSLWLAERQMNVKFKQLFGSTPPSLPLREGGKIVCANATRIPWEDVCPKTKDAEIYILGNPPYLGASMQTKLQKSDMEFVFDGVDNYKKQDYISCWFLKAAKYTNEQVKFAFVTTNSVCQGTQVEMTWPLIFQLGLEIFFAHKDFKWTNNAKSNAGVICSVIGVRNKSKQPKYIYINSVRNCVNNINAYLVNASDTIVMKSNKPLFSLPKMTSGNKPLDGGNLVLSELEKTSLLDKYPESNVLLRRFIGSREFINSENRWCLWIDEKNLNLALSISPIKERLEKVRQFRAEGGNNARNKMHTPHKFEFSNEPKISQIIVPRVSSERRHYIPIGFVDNNDVIADSAQVIFDAQPYVFGVVTSHIHMVWVRITAGRLKSDYRYSSFLSYHTFPIPKLSDSQKQAIEEHVYNVLSEREKHSEKTMAELYDPNKMPSGLREAHHNLDLAVERCYRSKPFTSDEERLEYLFKLYEEMTAKEQ